MSTLSKYILGALKEVCNQPSVSNYKEQILAYVQKLPNGFPTEPEELGTGLKVVPLQIEQPIDLHDKLEYHRSAFDLHYVAEGEDLFRLKPLNNCRLEYKSYDEKNDYGLYSDETEEEINLRAGDAILIDTNIAHMALCGKGAVKKLVFKIKK